MSPDGTAAGPARPDAPRTAVVVGSGSGGRAAAMELVRRGLRVTVLERGRVGGECPYTACVPSKVMLLTARAGLGWDAAVAAREEMVDGRDDHASVQGLEEAGVRLLRGRGRLTGPGAVTVSTQDGEERLEADLVVLAPGSSPASPPVDGLDEVATWTSVEALSATEQPASLAVLGGGAVGCELAQAFSGLGTRVTLLETADHLLPSEEPHVGASVGRRLTEEGLSVRTGVTVTSARQDGDEVVLTLEDAGELRVDRVLVAGGRTPSGADLGLERCGVDLLGSGHVPVDDRCRVLDGSGAAVAGLFALGDVTATSSYTHSANAQARVLADVATGGSSGFVPHATPRVVFTEPAVFGVGLTRAQAREQGTAVRYAEVELSDVERGVVTELVEKAAGATRTLRDGQRLSVLVEDGTDVVLGAAVTGPLADSWGAGLTFAVHHRATLSEVLDVQRPFLTWPEAVTAALDELRGG